MSSKDLQPPRVREPEPAPALVTHGSWPRGFEVNGTLLQELSGDIESDGVELAESRVERPRLDRWALRRGTLVDVIVTEPHIVDLSAREATVRGVRIEGGRIGALDLTGGHVDSLELRGIRIDYVGLAGAKLRDVVVADCHIGALDLPDATLDRVSIEGTAIDELGVRDAKLTHVDLRRATLGQVSDATALRGATITPAQAEQLAVQLARSAGIVLRDAD